MRLIVLVSCLVFGSLVVVSNAEKVFFRERREECPANSYGPDVLSGCTCNAGFVGTITVTSQVPLIFENNCIQSFCPINSQGVDVPSGCRCLNGYSGNVTKIISIAPTYASYTSTCAAVPCPENSNGRNVAAGCVCNNGYSGNIEMILSSVRLYQLFRKTLTYFPII